MASSTNQRHAADLRAACALFREQEMSLSSIDELERAVLRIADRLAGPTVVSLASRRRRTVKA